MTTLIQLARGLSKVPMAVASVALFALMVLTFADVVLRSTLNAPIQAATELIRIGIAVIVFAALPVLSGRGGHISVDLLDGLFVRAGLDRWRDAVIALACGAMLWFPAGRVVDLAQRARNYGDVTEYLEIPTFYVGLFIAGMIYLTAFILVGRGLLILLAPNSLANRT